MASVWGPPSRARSSSPRSSTSRPAASTSWEEREADHTLTVTSNPTRERIMHGYYVVVAVAAGALLVVAAGRPHAIADNEEETGASPATATLSPGEAPSHFPPAEITKFRAIAQDTLSRVQAGDQAAARARVKDLETVWTRTSKPCARWTRPPGLCSTAG